MSPLATAAGRIKDLGSIDYVTAYQVQQGTVKEVIEGAPHTLLFCEHGKTGSVGCGGAQTRG